MKKIPSPGPIPISSKRQGTVVSAKQSPTTSNRGSTQVVSLTPDNYKTGDTLTLDGVEYPITSVQKPNIKTKSGTPLVQKPATIQMPDNTTQPVKRFSFLIVKSF